VFVVGLSFLTLKFPVLALVVSVLILVAIFFAARTIWRWIFRPPPPKATA
jgi:hypothetical protein